MSRRSALWVLAIISALLVDVALPTLLASFDADKWLFRTLPLAPWELVLVVAASAWLTFVAIRFAFSVHQFPILAPLVLTVPAGIGLGVLVSIDQLLAGSTLAQAFSFLIQKAPLASEILVAALACGAAFMHRVSFCPNFSAIMLL